MNKILFFLLLHTVAYCSPLVEVRGGYFNFSNEKLRKIYKNGGLDLQLSGSFPICPYLDIYGSVEYAERSGYSLGAHERTRIQLLPISLGIKPVLPIWCGLDLYANVGPRYFFVNQKNYSQYVDKRVHQDGLGGFVGAGILWDVFCGFTLDAFAEYSFRQLHFYPFKDNVQGHTIEIGGYCVGLGLGYAF